jgi:hypothetical protein
MKTYGVAYFTPRKTAPATHCIGGWVKLKRDGLDMVMKRKIFAPAGNQTLVTQPVA